MNNHVHADFSKLQRNVMIVSMHEHFFNAKIIGKIQQLKIFGGKPLYRHPCKAYLFMTKSRCKNLFTTIAILIIERICIIHINAIHETHVKVPLKQKITI